MAVLLLDLGNTRVKWALKTRKGLSPSRALAHRDQSVTAELLRDWKNFQAPHCVLISNVASACLLNKVINLAESLWPDAEIDKVQPQRHAFGVTNAYQEPSKFGVDRWLCLVAARRFHSLPVCIVDCGTAITVDVLAVDGRHRGGLIAPGLSLMKQSLHRGTRDLCYSETRYPAGLATDTDAAIDSGTLYAAVGLIEWAIKRQPEDTQLILTGGDAQRVAEHLSIDARIEPDLVLQGLSILAEDR